MKKASKVIKLSKEQLHQAIKSHLYVYYHEEVEIQYVVQQAKSEGDGYLVYTK